MTEILVVGSGAREHAIVRALVGGDKKLYAAPGNEGIAEIAEIFPIDTMHVKDIAEFAQDNSIDFTVVGPERPLAEGIVDEFATPIFGPSKEAVMLESSKVWAADFKRRFNIPSPEEWTFTNYRDAKAFVKSHPMPMVVKGDKLADGKAVIVCKNVQDGVNAEALDAAKKMMVDGEFGGAGKEAIVIQEFLEGEELSVFALTDGKTIVPLIPARDHKTIFDNNEGPNTGGMGAYAPVPDVSTELMDEIYQRILVPTVEGMQELRIIYKGVIYLGLMLTKDGPKVLEYNARFGDPEAQVILPLLDSDLLSILEACVDGTLNEDLIRWKDGYCVCVAVASPGYPGQRHEVEKIYGLEEFDNGRQDIWILRAGKSGRILNVCAFGNTLKEAVENTYSVLPDKEELSLADDGLIPGKIYFKGMQFRRDIGRKAV